jgi:predicted acetyltransferase
LNTTHQFQADGLPRPDQAEIVTEPRPKGGVRFDLVHGGRSLSHLYVEPQLVHYGVAQVRVDHIGDVWTEEDCRGRGYSRRLISAAVDHMRAGDGAFSLLYGIGDFYHRFGYATLGADFGLTLRSDSPSAVRAAAHKCQKGGGSGQRE